MPFSLSTKARIGRIVALQARSKAKIESEELKPAACARQPSDTPVSPIRVARYRIRIVRAASRDLV